MIEMFFSKIAPSFQRYILVESERELVDRIYGGIQVTKALSQINL